jgi:hypothetical protein
MNGADGGSDIEGKAARLAAGLTRSASSGQATPPLQVACSLRELGELY